VESWVIECWRGTRLTLTLVVLAPLAISVTLTCGRVAQHGFGDAARSQHIEYLGGLSVRQFFPPWYGVE
jgi:hypothetical protein